MLSFLKTIQVLQTGQEINEISEAGFDVNSPTILAANVGDNRFIVQVCPSSVRLLDASASVVQELGINADFAPIASASAQDPHIALLGRDGRIGLVRFIAETSRLELTFPIPPKVCLFVCLISHPSGNYYLFLPSLIQNSPAVCLCLYHDVSGLFATQVPEMECSAAARLETVNNALTIRKEMDDEDEYLYGDTDAAENSRLTGDDPLAQLTPHQKYPAPLLN